MGQPVGRELPKSSSVVDKYIGESAHALIREMFNYARDQPASFMDEIDAIGSRRSVKAPAPTGRSGRPMELLNQMDG